MLKNYAKYRLHQEPEPKFSNAKTPQSQKMLNHYGSTTLEKCHVLP